MKTAIIAYSFSGNNLTLATYLQKRLSGDLFIIDQGKKKSGFSVFLDIAFKRTPTINAPFHIDDRYDHYVLLAPVWAGRIASPMRTFLKREAANLGGNYSFVTICGDGSTEQQKKLEGELESLTGSSPATFLELAVSKLFENNVKPVKMTSSYRINEADLQSFRQDLNHFVAQVKSKAYEPMHITR